VIDKGDEGRCVDVSLCDIEYFTDLISGKSRWSGNVFGTDYFVEFACDLNSAMYSLLYFEKAGLLPCFFKI
jgi:hypothetical protein